jgi:hypothetical protein
METTANDPFRFCDADGCTHDLSMGVLVSELLDRDGPHRIRSWTAPLAIRENLPEAA